MFFARATRLVGQGRLPLRVLSEAFGTVSPDATLVYSAEACG